MSAGFDTLYEEMYGPQPNNGKSRTTARLNLIQAIKEAIGFLPAYVTKDNLAQCNFPEFYSLQEFYLDFSEAFCFYLNGDLKEKDNVITSHHRNCFGEDHAKSGQLFHDPNGYFFVFLSFIIFLLLRRRVFYFS
jgi:hypothetical protein